METELPVISNEERESLQMELKQEFLESLLARRIHAIFEPDIFVTSIDELADMVKCSFEEAEYCVISILIPLNLIKKTSRGYSLAIGRSNYIDEPEEVVIAENACNRIEAHGEMLIQIANETRKSNDGTVDFTVILTLNDELANWYMKEISKLDKKILKKASELNPREKKYIMTSIHGIVRHKIEGRRRND